MVEMGGHLTLHRRLHRLPDQIRQHTIVGGQPKTIELGLLHQPRHLLTQLGRQRCCAGIATGREERTVTVSVCWARRSDRGYGSPDAVARRETPAMSSEAWWT
jgi:hypothetical protein